MISVSIDVNKIDKSKIYKGEKGNYLKLVLFETPNGEYGDFMVKQDQSKEEREAGNKMPILGNGKYLGDARTTPGPRTSRPAPPLDDDTSEIPF